jgi:hypothetical protein
MVAFSSGMMSAQKNIQRREKREFLIYGHTNPVEQAKERNFLETIRQAAEAAQDSNALQRAEFKLTNLGRKIHFDTLLALEGSANSKDWQIKPTCSCCGETVHLHGVNSLKVKTTYAHPPLDPATKPEQRCALRSNLDERYVGHEGTHDPALARKNRAAFYQPEIVAHFVQVAKHILGHDYKPEMPETILQNADKAKLWDKVHDPKLAPFQLLALTGNKFDVTFDKGTHGKIGFHLEKNYSVDDINNNRTEPSDIRLYGHFSVRRNQGQAKLWTIPGLKRIRPHLVSQKWVRAQQEVTARQPDLISTPIPQAHYGKASGYEYIIVNHNTAQKLAPYSYTTIHQAMTQGGTVSEIQQTLLIRTDALIDRLGAGPLRQKHGKTSKASAPLVAKT